MTPQNGLLESSRELHNTLRRFRFCENPFQDLNERLALLTVVLGHRHVAGFGFAEENNEGSLRRIRDILVNHGIRTLITQQLKGVSARVCEDVSHEIVDVFDRVDEQSARKFTGKVLWAFSSSEQAAIIGKAVRGEAQVGALLGYPSCCVSRTLAMLSKGKTAFVKAIVARVGEDPGAVEKALRHDQKVEVPADTMMDANVPRTVERFPFVFHIACDTCLGSDTSPSAELNDRDGQVAASVDENFHDTIQRVAALLKQIEHTIRDTDGSLLDRNELDSRQQESLKALHRDCHQIHAEFLLGPQIG